MAERTELVPISHKGDTRDKKELLDIWTSTGGLFVTKKRHSNGPVPVIFRQPFNDLMELRRRVLAYNAGQRLDGTSKRK